MIFESGTSDFIYFNSRIMEIHEISECFMKKQLCHVFKIIFIKKHESLIVINQNRQQIQNIRYFFVQKRGLASQIHVF